MSPQYRDESNDSLPAYNNASEPYSNAFYQYPQQSHDTPASLTQPQVYPSTGNYMPLTTTILSFSPSGGQCGTEVSVNFTCTYSLSHTTIFSLFFGSVRCQAKLVSSPSNPSIPGSYIVSAFAPSLYPQTSESVINVALTLDIQDGQGQDLCRSSVGTFALQTPPVGLDGMQRQDPGMSAENDISPKSVPASVAPEDSARFPYTTARPSMSYYPATNDWAQQNYRPQSSHEANQPITGRAPISPYQQIPSSSWSYGGNVDSSPNPPLIRTSVAEAQNNPVADNINFNRARLVITGYLKSMTEKWTPREQESQRRIVAFSKKQSGPVLTVYFREVPEGEPLDKSKHHVSCIYWRERQGYYITSVDTIALLEKLLVAPSRFTVEEKNRIRRNLEGFRPITVSKAKADSENFFKVIMGLGIPKPRNIEKDIKVFPWSILEQALRKIISKYSTPISTSSVPSSSTSSNPLLASNMGGGARVIPDHIQPFLPPPSTQQQQSIISPRSLSGSSGSWTGNNYSISPSGRPSSPQMNSHSMRLNSMINASLPGPLSGGAGAGHGGGGVQNVGSSHQASHSSGHASTASASSGAGGRWNLSSPSYGMAAAAATGTIPYGTNAYSGGSHSSGHPIYTNTNAYITSTAQRA